MARMSIDDKFLRDPRITQLALDLGMSRWEAMGRMLAVFAVCYDLERDVVGAPLIDHAADHAGFADAMFAVDLAVNTKRGMRIRGAGKRIEYLAPKREAGRQGGLKSAESRREKAKQKRAEKPEAAQAFLNPPDPVPDVVPDPVPEDQISLAPRAHAIPQSVPRSEPPSVPAVSLPAPAPGDIARTHGADRRTQTENGQNRPVRALAATRSELVESIAGPYNPDDPRAIGRLAEVTWRRVSDAAIGVAAELQLPPPLPFPAITPSSLRAGFRDLASRIREEGALAPAACDRAVENLVKQARSKRSVEWLAEKAFGDKAWVNARNGVDPSARPARPASGRTEQTPMPTPPKFAPEVPIKNQVRDAGEFVKLYERLTGDGQRAPPRAANASDDPDEDQPESEAEQ